MFCRWRLQKDRRLKQKHEIEKCPLKCPIKYLIIKSLFKKCVLLLHSWPQVRNELPYSIKHCAILSSFKKQSQNLPFLPTQLLKFSLTLVLFSIIMRSSTPSPSTEYVLNPVYPGVASLLYVYVRCLGLQGRLCKIVLLLFFQTLNYCA